MSAGKKIWTTGWRVALCALLLIWIFHSIFLREGRTAVENLGQHWGQLTRMQQWEAAWHHGPRQLWHSLSLVGPLPFFVSVLLMGGTILLGVIRWRMVLRVQGLDLPFSRAAEISFIAHFFNSFLLGSTGGDLLKAYYAARETHHKKTEAVTTVFVDRLIGLFSMLLFACVMMLPNYALLARHDALGPIAGVVVAMMLACGVLVYLAFWGGLTNRWPNLRLRLQRIPKADVLQRSLESCRRFGQEKNFLLQTTLLSMVLNTLCVLQVGVLALGMNLSIAPLALLVIVPIVICISALPITPSGLGVRENLFVIMLAAPEINVDATHALSLSLLAYAGSLFWSIIGGFVYAGLRERHHLREVTEAQAPDNAAG